MFASIKVATIRGIPIRLHFTLLVVIALLIFRLGLIGIPAGIVLFGSVLLHELGHSVVAQRYGIRIASIDLHILGGMALMTSPPKTARQEIWIAAAGPGVSVALGVIFSALAVLTGASLAFVNPGLVDLLAYAAAINVMMAIFNLVPALPMDGGRIFRAALSTKLGALRATRIAATVSRVFAVLFILFGLVVGNWSLMLIGGLLFMMVGNEERLVEQQELLRQHAARYHPHGPGAPYFGSAFTPGAPSPSSGVVVDVGETREEFVDPQGRRYVVVTRVVK